MANLSQSECRHLYSWWWDSHNTPKNSKWLQDNIADMDGRVKSMIKLIELDADSFARRAEMYYKKRPELMKLVEEFYRAYRALAERYDHATGELRHAHKTIAAAFPDQAPFELIEDSPSHSLGRELEFGTPDIEDPMLLSETKILALKKALADMEAEKQGIFLCYHQCLEKLTKIEAELSNAQMDSIRLNEKASRAEIEVQTLKEALFQLEIEKEKECLGKITELENVVSSKEDEASMLKKQLERNEIEVYKLKKVVADMNKEKEASSLQYKHCLETIGKLEKSLSTARDEVERLNSIVLIGTSKLKTSEEERKALVMSNQALQVEAENLVKKIAMKDEELSNKEEELVKLHSCLQDENKRHAHAEATLETLQNLHTQSQDDQRALAMELRNMLCLLEDVEASTHGLEEELHHVRDENHSFSETPFSLREIKERLEKKVTHLMSINISLQHEISCLKEEVEGLNKSYHALFEQVESASLNPTCLGISIKSLKDENSRLKQMHEEETSEKEILLKKLENIEEVLNTKVVAESILSGSMYHEKLKTLQESSQLLQGEKATLVAEKASLLSQLQATTENTNNLLRQNAVLENSLSAARVELEGLREKSKGLQEICNMLKNERSFLLNERDTLVYKLESVERKLQSLDKMHLQLKEKFAELEKENEATHFQVEKLEASLGEAKRERIGSEILSGTKMAGLENEIHLLQEEKKKSEQELEKALKAQFEISILQKFIKDMESKNHSLIVECQKHVEASNLAEKVILELESDSLEQQVEAELLLDEIGRLRLGIYEIFTALESPDCAEEDEVGKDWTLVHRILESVEGMKCAISKHEDEKQQLFVENSVLEALLEQLKSKGMEIELQKVDMEQEAKIMANKLSILSNEKEELLEINAHLKLDSSKAYETATILEDEFRSLRVKQSDFQSGYNALQEAYSQAKEENAYLLKKSSDLNEEKRRVVQHNDDTLLEFLAMTNQNDVLKNFAMEKTKEVKSLLEDLNRQLEVNSCLGREMNELVCKLDLQKEENSIIKDTVCSLEREMHGVKEFNAQMKKEITNSTERLVQTQAKLFDTEMQLEATEKMNIPLYRTVAELRIDVQSSELIREDIERNMEKLSEANLTQMKEIQSLQKVNENLDSELGLLHQEMEENAVREQTLSIELQGMNNESEVWEAEAANFCFNRQASSVQEVLLKDKVKELTLVCKSLEVKSAAKTSEFEQMKGQICVMENEINRLKSQVSSYGPVIASLTDDITLLELKAASSHGTEFLEFAVLPNEATPSEDQTILTLQNLQKRVQLVGKMMEETNKSVLRRRSNPKNKQERSHRKAYTNTSEISGSPRLQRTKTKSVKVRNTMLMKDIPLDQASNGSIQNRGDDLMLELWETVEDENQYPTNGSKGRGKNHDHFDLPSTDSDMEKELAVDKLELSSTTTEPNQELNDENILNRLASDADKLDSLKTTLHNLRRKLDTNKKGKKGKNKDFETVKEHVQEAEDSLAHLLDLNVQLVKNLQDCPHYEVASPRMKETVKVWRGKVMEEAEKGSERLDLLLLGVQRIQFFVSKMEDEGKRKGSEKFLRSRTVILRDFIHSGRKNSARKKKGPNCGCFAQQNSSGSLTIS